MARDITEPCTLGLEQPDMAANVDFLDHCTVKIKVWPDRTVDIDVVAGEYGETVGSFTVNLSDSFNDESEDDDLWTDGGALNAALARMGLTIEPRDPGRKAVLRDGVVLVTGRADEVWAWVHARTPSTWSVGDTLRLDSIIKGEAPLGVNFRGLMGGGAAVVILDGIQITVPVARLSKAST